MKQQIINAAAYGRLSREDENAGESNSIINQKVMLSRYIEEQGWNLYDYYLDDGYSGTNFERPEFERMLTDIESKKIDVVVTKDLSRLGRDYLKTGYYTEIFFKERNVRYIAVNDGFDSDRQENDIAPFRNLLNEMYVKDLSRKMSSAWKSIALDGGFTGKYPPFGYKWDSENKHKIIPDEETAPIVNQIFEWAYEGYGIHTIRQNLQLQRVLKPSAWHNKRDARYFVKYLDGEDSHFEWNHTAVRDILRNPVYIGNQVHYKTVGVSLKSKKRIQNPEEKWMVVENANEAIVKKEVWSQVQESISARHRPRKDGDFALFSGLLKCADCGYNLTYKRSNNDEKGYPAYYICTTYRSLGKDKCLSHIVNQNRLYALVLEDVQKCAAAVMRDKAKIIDLLNAGNSATTNKQKKKSQVELQKVNSRLSELSKLIKGLYEEYMLKNLSRQSYNALLESYQAEQEKLMEKVAALENSYRMIDEKLSNATQWSEIICKYENLQELTRPILSEIIDKIVVHQKGKDNEQRIEIHYRFVGEVIF